MDSSKTVVVGSDVFRSHVCEKNTHTHFQTKKVQSLSLTFRLPTYGGYVVDIVKEGS